jgi:membrane fusion protein (multidrug efflux system)
LQEEQNKKSSRGPLFAVLALLLAISGLVYWKMNSGSPAGGPPGMGSGGPGKVVPQKVTGYIVKKEILTPKMETNGTLLSWNELQLVPEVAGRIDFLNLREGSRVEKGETLLILFNDDIRAQITKLELQLAIARKNLERLEELFKSNGVSRQEIDNAENQVNNIKSDLKIYQANLRKTTLTAPFAGMAGLTNASVGSYVNPGNPIASLQQISPLKLEFSIPEKYAGMVKTGQSVLFSIENKPDTFKATVYALEPKIDPSSRTLKLRARFENPGEKLMPGLFARVSLNFQKSDDNLMVPSQSIIPETRGKKVLRCRNGIAESVMVETGIRNKDKVQITSGLSEGDTILTSGLMFVKPGSPLIITRLQEK